MTEVGGATTEADRVEILGVPVDRVSMEDTLRRIDAFVAEKTPHLIITADAAGIAQAQSDPDLKALYRSAALVTPDSSGVLWAAKRLGKPIASRVSGVEIVSRVCAASAQRGYRIFLLGAAPGVAELAAEKLRLMHPGCNIVGTRHGYFPPESDAVVAEEIAPLKPDVLFVAMGIPRQEKFIRATEEIIRASVGIGVGGSLDVYSGRAKRAPVLIQKIKMEWLWRLILNPRKLSKAKMLPKFVGMVLRSGR